MELIDLKGGCNSVSLPEYNMAIEGATGLLIEDKILICGGRNENDTTNECYQLNNENDAFQLVYSMKKERAFSKSILFQGDMLVTGGFNPHEGFFIIFGNAKFSHFKVAKFFIHCVPGE